MVESYRDLVAWQKAMELVESIYKLTEQLPDAERFGLISQLRRAAVSIPSTLAEGHARASTREFTRFLSIARGSLAEVETQILLAERLGFARVEATRRALDQCDEQGRLLRGLKKALDQRIASRDPQRALAPHPSSLVPSQ
jgi:four helix bundle protein